MPNCRRKGVSCCRNTIAKLMRLAQIVPRSVRRFRITTDSRNTLASADLVQRRFEAQQPNQCCHPGDSGSSRVTTSIYSPTRVDSGFYEMNVCVASRRRLASDVSGASL
jgi:transposase InsO family protein